MLKVLYRKFQIHKFKQPCTRVLIILSFWERILALRITIIIITLFSLRSQIKKLKMCMYKTYQKDELKNLAKNQKLFINQNRSYW